MVDQVALFLILVLLWIGFRFLARRWLWARISRGQTSIQQGIVLHAAMVALLPLLFLPWAMSEWVLVVAFALVVFVFHIGLALLYGRFIRSSS